MLSDHKCKLNDNLFELQLIIPEHFPSDPVIRKRQAAWTENIAPAVCPNPGTEQENTGFL
jgi:hypothetical protein